MWVLNGAPRDRPPATDTDPPDMMWRAALAQTGLTVDQLVPEVHRLTAGSFARKLDALRRYASQLPTLEQGFGRLDDPELLGYEVTWRASAAR